MSRGVICAVVAALAVTLHAQPPANWAAARNGHFEVYSQDGRAAALSGLAWPEELRAFVIQQTGLTPDTSDPVRVIAFRSPQEYAPYRLQSLSDAYYVGAANRHYLVLPSFDAQSLGTAAHEYSHFLFHMAGLELPPWLKEGMAEVFSSTRVSARRSQIGGDLPGRAQLLRRSAWLPLGQILSWSSESPLHDNRDAVALFYAQSWALTEMLALSPGYRSGFPSLVTAISTGVPSGQALVRVYGKPLERIANDLRMRAGQRRPVPLSVPGALPSSPALPEVSDVSPFAVRFMLAEVLLLAEDFDRARTLYRDLQREAPDRAEVTAGLGAVAFAQGDRENAQRLWKLAIQQGLADADVCYRYALLLDKAGEPADELRTALELVVRLRPDFEDARFRLGLLEENSGRHEAALAQLKAIAQPAPQHSYHYWCAVTQALIGLGRNQDAGVAAGEALQHASNSEERAHALQFERIAHTHFEVQFTRDSSGNLVLTATRAPNDASNWNAFVEPGDDLRRVEGTLREIECGDSGLRVLVDTAAGRIAVSIPDPSHVQVRNGPSEFVCGAQAPRTVMMEYAARRQGTLDGIARGIEFR